MDSLDDTPDDPLGEKMLLLTIDIAFCCLSGGRPGEGLEALRFRRFLREDSCQHFRYLGQGLWSKSANKQRSAVSFKQFNTQIRRRYFRVTS